jgi:hypothetical protein
LYSKFKQFLGDAQQCDINACSDENGKTFLSLAVRYNPAICSALLKRGSRVNVRDFKGKSPLSWAVSLGRIETIKLLLHYGALVTQEMIDNCPPGYMRDLLEQAYDKQKCCICYENPKDMADIPCGKIHMHSFMCKECYGLVRAGNNQCPLCRGILGEYGA